MSALDDPPTTSSLYRAPKLFGHPNKLEGWVSRTCLEHEVGNRSIDHFERNQYVRRSLGSVSHCRVTDRKRHPRERRRELCGQLSVAVVDLHLWSASAGRHVFTDERRAWRKLQRLLPVGHRKKMWICVSPPECNRVHAESAREHRHVGCVVE